MDAIKIDAIKKTWYEIARHTAESRSSFEIEIYKKLQNIFHVGNYYYYVFNCSTAQVEFVKESVTEVLGLTSPEGFTIEHLLSVIHPDDLPYFISFENEVTAFFTQLPADKVLKYKVSYDYRVRKTDGSYIRLLQQVVTIQTDEQGAVIRVLGIHTDITHLNKGNGSTLSFIGLEGEPSYHDVKKGVSSTKNDGDLLTKKELQVLRLLLQGKSSKEIAAKLFISKLTVQGHRKSMLKKTNSASTVELSIRAIQENWV